MSDRITDLRLQIEQIQALRAVMLDTPDGYDKYHDAMLEAAPTLLEGLPLLLNLYEAVVEHSINGDTGDYACVICGEHRGRTKHAGWCPMVALEAWSGGGVESGEGGRQLPSIAEMTGIDSDFTGPLSTAEYLRSIRGGQSEELLDKVADLEAENEALREVARAAQRFGELVAALAALPPPAGSVRATNEVHIVFYRRNR